MIIRVQTMIDGKQYGPSVDLKLYPWQVEPVLYGMGGDDRVLVVKVLEAERGEFLDTLPEGCEFAS